MWTSLQHRIHTYHSRVDCILSSSVSSFLTPRPLSSDNTPSLGLVSFIVSSNTPRVSCEVLVYVRPRHWVVDSYYGVLNNRHFLVSLPIYVWLVFNPPPLFVIWVLHLYPPVFFRVNKFRVYWWRGHCSSWIPRDSGPRPVSGLTGGRGWTTNTPGHLHTVSKNFCRVYGDVTCAGRGFVSSSYTVRITSHSPVCLIGSPLEQVCSLIFFYSHSNKDTRERERTRYPESHISVSGGVEFIINQ